MNHLLRDPREYLPYTANSTGFVSSVIYLVPVSPPEPIKTDRGVARGSEVAKGGETSVDTHGETPQDVDERIAAEKLTPPSGVLLEISRRSTPPQDWWDEDFEGL